jgi:hypothetical protein
LRGKQSKQGQTKTGNGIPIFYLSQKKMKSISLFMLIIMIVVGVSFVVGNEAEIENAVKLKIEEKLLKIAGKTLRPSRSPTITYAPAPERIFCPSDCVNAPTGCFCPN